MKQLDGDVLAGERARGIPHDAGAALSEHAMELIAAVDAEPQELPSGFASSASSRRSRASSATSARQPTHWSGGLERRFAVSAMPLAKKARSALSSIHLVIVVDRIGVCSPRPW